TQVKRCCPSKDNFHLAPHCRKDRKASWAALPRQDSRSNAERTIELAHIRKSSLLAHIRKSHQFAQITNSATNALAMVLGLFRKTNSRRQLTAFHRHY